MQRVCLVCKSALDSWWKFCLKCGARVDDDLLNEVRSIDYILGEIKKWHEQMLINYYIEQRLTKYYEDRRAKLVESLLPPQAELKLEIEEPIQQPLPPTPIVKQEPPPIRVRLKTARPVEKAAQEPASVKPAPPAEPVPVVPPKSLAELVAENIRLIFAISSALFVGGIVLYYRNEIYHGLKQPITQASLLALITLGSIISGWTLVRRTAENLAGRTLTLVGSLLVPINPWFLVRSHLIPDTGNTWILGLACTALYAWTAYFLRERLYVYLALATGLITSWTAVYKFTGGASASISASIYAVVLMACSIVYLLAEKAFKPKAEGVEFSREEYGQPFFHVAQTGVALSLLFYTPLIAILPEEFVAAKRYFDPQSYNSLVTIWLALAGAFVYFYSSISRRAGYFVYLSIAALLWAEVALLHNLRVTMPTAVLAFVAAALVMNLIARFSPVSEFFTQPLGRVAALIGWAICLFTVYALLLLAVENHLTLSWRMLIAMALAAAIFGINLVKTKGRDNFYPAGILLTAACFFSLLKINIAKELIPIFLLVPAYVALLLKSKLRSGEWEFLAEDLHNGALIIASSVFIGALVGHQALIAHKLALALFALELAGIFVFSAFETEGREPRIVQLYIGIFFATLSYGSLLNSFSLAKHNFALLMMLLSYALISCAVLLQRKLDLVQSSSENEQSMLLPYESLKNALMPLKASAFVLTLVAIAFWTPLLDLLDQNRSAGVLLMLEFAGVFAALSYTTLDRPLSLIGFFITGLFLTASYSFILWIMADHGAKAEYSLTEFALWAMALYAVTRIDKLRQEIKTSFSLLSSIIAGILFIICAGIIYFDNLSLPTEKHFASALILALLVIGLKEALHLLKSRSPINSTFTGLIGIALLATFLNMAAVNFETRLFFGILLAIAYAVVSQYLRRRKVERRVFYPIEVLANLITAASLVLILFSYSTRGGFVLMAFFVTGLAALFYVLSAYLTGETAIGRTYAHAAAGALLISASVLFNHYGARNWSELSGLLVPLLTIYLLSEFPLRGSLFSGTAFAVAQVALPLVVALGLWSGLSEPVTHLGTALFFAEVTTFYILSACFKQEGNFFYPGLLTFAVSLWQILLHFNISNGYYMGFYALLGFALLLLSLKAEESRFDWAREALFNFVNLLFIFSTVGAAFQSIAEMSLRNRALNPLIGTLLVIIAVGALSSIVSKVERLSRVYRQGTFAVACFAYFVVGIRLGYDILRQTEFYSIPVGAALLTAGYLGTRKMEERAAALWLWFGSLLWILPLLLHTLQYRFVTHESSTQHDIGLLVVSLTLILSGIMLQLKAPTIVGGASFLIGMSVIVFGFVGGEQKWLSISMIVLALVIFASSWIIYFFHKRNKLGNLRDQGRQAMEEFGKWK